MNRIARTLLLPISLLVLPGCLSLTTLDANTTDNKTREAEHNYTFYFERTMEIVDLQQCAMAAKYFNGKWTWATRGLTNDLEFRKRLQEDFAKRGAEDSEKVVARCLEEHAPAMTEAARYKDLIEMYEELSELPVPEARKGELVYLSKTTKLLEARATADRGLAEWEANRFGAAISLLSSAAYTAKGLKDTAKPEQIAEFVDLHAKYLRDRVAMLVKDAGRFAKNPDTHHLALISYARAYDLGKDNAHKRKANALKKALLESAFYDYRMSVKGDPTVSRLAMSKLKKSGIPGNTRSVRGRDLDVVVTLGKPEFQLKKRSVTLSGQYADGTQLVMNPEYKQIAKYMERMDRCRMGGFSSYNESDCRFSGGNGAVDSNRREYERASKVLRSTPQQIQETSYSTHRYDAVEHKWTLVIPMRQTITVRGKKKTYDEKIRVEHVDHTHAKVPILKLSQHTARGLGETKMLQNAGGKLYSLADAFIKKDHGKWLSTFPERGTRGQVLYMLMTRENSSEFTKAIEAETLVSHAGRALRAL